jgi:hypothetical protein
VNVTSYGTEICRLLECDFLNGSTVNQDSRARRTNYRNRTRKNCKARKAGTQAAPQCQHSIEKERTRWTGGKATVKNNIGEGIFSSAGGSLVQPRSSSAAALWPDLAHGHHSGELVLRSLKAKKLAELVSAIATPNCYPGPFPNRHGIVIPVLCSERRTNAWIGAEL